MEKLKVLIADDSIIYRKMLSQAVEATDLGTVVQTASNGVQAMEWMRQRPDTDMVLLDLSMPQMDGLEALKRIKKDYPATEVIMISAGGPNNAAITLEALKLGAVDFVLKPSGDNMEKNLERIRTLLQMIFTQVMIKRMTSVRRPRTEAGRKQSNPLGKESKAVVPPLTASQKSIWSGANLVVIASSTGGPTALDTVLCGIPADFDKPILIIQHMPADFTKVLAQSLDKKCRIPVSEGKNGDVVKNGQMILAPGGLHMTVEPGGVKTIRLLDTPYVNGVRPAADVLFHSVAEAYEGKNVLAVILTGMGSDGMRGVAAIKQKCGCYCITQSEETCVVYGMPKSTYDAGLSDEVADLKNIAARIQKVASGK